VEIARAVRQHARIIIFDEPTASLTPEEKFHFFGLMKRLKQSGVSIIFISHALEEALQNADRITVLRDGQHVLTDSAGNLDRAAVIRAMVGRNLSGEIYGIHAAGRTVRKRGRKVLSVQNLSMGSMVRNTSFSVYAGQVTGMFGLIGSGRTETAKIIAGVVKRDMFHGGEVKLDNRPVRYRVPQPAVRDGIVYVTEDRKVEGFFETMSIGGNLNICAMATKCGIFSLVNMAEMRRLAKKWIEAIKIRAINGDARVIELSGGKTPKLIVFDEPTRGVDVGAIAEIHQFINQLADEGMAVVVISSYLPEIMNLSDRILVTRQGRVVEEFTAREATEERIMYAAVH
jgi:simple sugar transport system ATP-binding protein